MKKMTLFEIGLKCDVDQYDGHVAAEDAGEAETVARKAMLADYIIYWEEEGRVAHHLGDMDESVEVIEEGEEFFQEQMKELDNARLTKLIEVGKVIIPS